MTTRLKSFCQFEDHTKNPNSWILSPFFFYFFFCFSSKLLTSTLNQKTHTHNYHHHLSHHNTPSPPSSSADCPPITDRSNVKIFGPLLLPKYQNSFFLFSIKGRRTSQEQRTRASTFTWVLGKADVRKVSWVSSIIFRLGMLSINAAWSEVAAMEVIL